MAIGILYVAAVLATVRSARPGFTLQIAIVSSALVIAGAFPIPMVSLLTPYVFANRALALITIWVTATLVHNYKKRTAETARLAALVTFVRRCHPQHDIRGKDRNLERRR